MHPVLRAIATELINKPKIITKRYFFIAILYTKLVKKKYTTEASGGVNLNNIKKIASTGVDRVSIGMLTQSVSAIDIKLEI